VVVTVLAEFAVTVTVTVTALGFPVVVEDVLDNLDNVEELSKPVTPPVTPAAFIRATTLLSLVQSRDVP